MSDSEKTTVELSGVSHDTEAFVKALKQAMDETAEDFYEDMKKVHMDADWLMTLGYFMIYNGHYLVINADGTHTGIQFEIGAYKQSYKDKYKGIEFALCPRFYPQRECDTHEFKEHTYKISGKKHCVNCGAEEKGSSDEG